MRPARCFSITQLSNSRDRTGETEREPGTGAYRRYPLPEAPGQPE